MHHYIEKKKHQTPLSNYSIKSKVFDELNYIYWENGCEPLREDAVDEVLNLFSFDFNIDRIKCLQIIQEWRQTIWKH